MPAPVTDAGEKLRKLGERLRKGFTILHPASEKSLDTVRQAVRDQWQREQIDKQKSQGLGIQKKDRSKRPSEPDRER